MKRFIDCAAGAALPCRLFRPVAAERRAGNRVRFRRQRADDCPTTSISAKWPAWRPIRKGNIFVYTRTGHPTVSLGTRASFAHGGSRLYQFDRNGKFTREIGKEVYGFLFAAAGARRSAGQHLGRRRDDQHGDQVRSRQGRVAMLLGRKAEAVRIRRDAGRGGGEGGGGGRAAGAGAPQDLFDRPTDVAWDAAGEHLRRRRPRQCARRQVHERRRVREVVGLEGHRAGQFDDVAQHRRRRAGQCLRRRRRQQPHPGVRQAMSMYIY